MLVVGNEDERPNIFAFLHRELLSSFLFTAFFAFLLTHRKESDSTINQTYAFSEMFELASKSKSRSFVAVTDSSTVITVSAKKSITYLLVGHKNEWLMMLSICQLPIFEFDSEQSLFPK